MSEKLPEKTEKKKFDPKKLVSILLPFAIGIGGGLVISSMIDFDHLASMDPLEFIFALFKYLLVMYAAFFVQIIVHEAGHLVFGLATGYGFVSFRILNLMIVKTKEGMKFRRMTLTGTGGQCLLSPPAVKDGKYPYVLYHLGGVLLNAIVTLLLVPVMLFSEGILHLFVLMMILTGVIIILSNGIPMKNKEISNDGYNALHMGEDTDSLKAMYRQLQINALEMEGQRLTEMPEEFFEVADGANLHNPFISTLKVFRENRLMDAHCFDEAAALIEECLSDKMTVLGIYQAVLKMDRYTIELLKDPDTADGSVLKEKSVKAVMTSMKENPLILRTQIADAALREKDEKKLEKLLAYFDKVTPYYPSQGGVETEKEIISLLIGKRSAGTGRR